jgi:cytochrome P450
LDSTTDWLFGESIYSLKSTSTTDASSAFREAFDTGMNRASMRIFLADLLWATPFYHDKILEKQSKIVFSYTDPLIDKAIENAQRLKSHLDQETTEPAGTFLDRLARDTSDRAEIRSQLLQMVAAARDTTAALISNLWFILSRRPDIVARIRKEMELLNGKHPDAASIKKLVYLNATIKEALRYFSVVPLGTRVANKVRYQSRVTIAFLAGSRTDS